MYNEINKEKHKHCVNRFVFLFEYFKICKHYKKQDITITYDHYMWSLKIGERITMAGVLTVRINLGLR
jgi:hypothetical protein